MFNFIIKQSKNSYKYNIINIYKMSYDKMSDAQKRQSSMKVEDPTKPNMGDLKKKVVKKVVKKAKAITKKKTKTLTEAQEIKLKKHKNHTDKHMKMMREMMERGETFKDAHIKTVSQVGN